MQLLLQRRRGWREQQLRFITLGYRLSFYRRDQPRQWCEHARAAGSQVIRRLPMIPAVSSKLARNTTGCSFSASPLHWLPTGHRGDGTADATAYAIRTLAGDLKVMVVNKEPVQDLTLTIDAGQTIQNATLQLLLGPSLAATSGITIQGSTVEKDGTFTPEAPTALASVGQRPSAIYLR